MPSGLFDHWKPATDVSQWVRIPPQLWNYQIQTEDYEVIDVEEVWYEYVNHFIPRIKRSFNCSAGAGRTEPCYGCAIRRDFYDEMRRIKEQTGVDEKKWAPLSASRRFAFSITSLEEILMVPVRDAKGRVRKSKNDKVLYNFVPKPLYTHDETVRQPKSKRGHNFHWSMGTEHFQQLADYDLECQNKDAITGDDLLCFGVACPACEEAIHMFDDLLTGEDITEWRIKEVGCPHCGAKELPIPLLKHPERPEFEQGSITSFDIRVKAVPLNEDKTALKITGVRLPDYDEELVTLVNNPLNLAEIMAPTPIRFQETILRDMAEGVNPRANKKAPAKKYSENEDDGDIDYNDEDDKDEDE